MSYKPPVHQTYVHPTTGEYLPGVTTICGRHPDGKQAMLGSAVKLTKQGVDYRMLWDFKAKCGTCCHEMVQNHIMGLGPIDKAYWAPEIYKKAGVGFRAFKKWERAAKPVYLGSELVVINAELGYGGSVDIWAYVDGAVRVIDLKTGGFWNSAKMQIAAYDAAVWDELGRGLTPGFNTSFEKGTPCGLQLDLSNGSYSVHHLMQPEVLHRWSQFLNLLDGWKLERSV